jgi:hypothetical protein
VGQEQTTLSDLAALVETAILALTRPVLDSGKRGIDLRQRHIAASIAMKVFVTRKTGQEKRELPLVR